MQNYSKAGIGIAIVTIMEVILPMLGIDAPEGSIAKVLDAVATIVGFVLMIWGQIDRPDLIGGIKRR